jgi:hypothetical protein
MASSWFNKYFPCLLTLLVAASVGLALSATVQGQQSQLLVDYVPPSFLQTNSISAVSSLPRLIPADSTNRTIASAPTRHTSVDRWENFEAEFGIKKTEPSFVKSSIQSTKYKVDETVFAAKEFVESFRYDVYLKDLMTSSSSTAPSRRYYSDPIQDSLENAQIKSGVDWDAHAGHAFVGIKLVLPIGD